MLRIPLAFESGGTLSYLSPFLAVRIDVVYPLRRLVVVTHFTAALGASTDTNLLQRDSSADAAQRPAQEQRFPQLQLSKMTKGYNSNQKEEKQDEKPNPPDLIGI